MKINFCGNGCIDPEGEDRHVAYALSLGLPDVDSRKAGGKALAIVGGGPSINEYVDELKAWQGDIFAINGAWKWCEKNGIDAYFFTCDPSIEILPMVEGVKRAVLSTCCHPEVFDSLKDSQVMVYGVGRHGFPCGPSSATSIPVLALKMGYAKVTFFGCESAYNTSQTQTHAYAFTPSPLWLKVKTEDGIVHLTEPGLILQAELLAEVLREFPDIYTERCGGLLRSLVIDPEWEAVELSHALNDDLGFKEK